MNLDEINKTLGPDGAADLQKILADIKAVVAASGEGLLADKQKELDAVILDRDAAQKKCEAIIAKLADPGATKDDAKAEADKTENARKREELLAQKKDADAKAAEIQAQLDALPADASEKLKAAKLAPPPR